MQRYNVLLNEIRSQLEDLEKGIQGLVVMSSELEEIFICIFEARVPSSWLKVSQSSQPRLNQGAHFTDVFSIAIQIRRKCCFALNTILTRWSPQNFAHDMTAVLSWHVQNLLQSDGQLLDYSKAKSPLNLNCK